MKTMDEFEMVRSFRMNDDSKMVLVTKFTRTKHNKHVQDMIWLGNCFFYPEKYIIKLPE
jgi:hypothetical protein